MKSITLENVSTVTPPPFIGPMKYYGFRFVTGAGFVMQESYRSGDFVAVSGEGLTVKNSWNTFNSGSLITCLNKLIRNQAEVFEFDTDRHLFLWLSYQK